MSRVYQLLDRASQLTEKKAYQEARVALRTVLEEDKTNEVAWLAFLDTCQEPSERRRVVQQWVRCDPTSLTAQRYYEETNTVHIALPSQKVSPWTWLSERVSTLSLSSAVIAVFMLTVWLFISKTAVFATNETVAESTVRYLQSRLADSENRVQLLNDELFVQKSMIKQLSTENGLLQERVEAQQSEIAHREGNMGALLYNLRTLEEQNAQLSDTLLNVKAERDTYLATLSQTKQYPFTTISNGTITLHHQLQNNSVKAFTIPYEAYETFFTHIGDGRIRNGTMRLSNNANMMGRFPDLSPFVRPDSVQSLANAIVEGHTEEEVILTELWNFVHQIDANANELGNTPQFPLDTLVKGKGELEDKSILLASLIAAVKPEWEVTLYYIDKDHIDNPQIPNYLFVHVGTPGKKYYIDAANTEEMQPHGVIGFYEWDIWSNQP